MLTDRYPQIKGLILDMDGVLWHDSEPIGNLPKLFETLNQDGLKVVFATNNATRTIDEYLEKMANFGIQVNPNQIITSAETTAIYIVEKFEGKKSAYVVGTDSLKEILRSKGIEVVSEDNFRDANMVVVGMDIGINYEKIRNAALLVRAGAEFIATNTDATYPTPEGLFPGAGAMVAAIQTTSGRSPLIIGKPSTLMYEQAFRRLGTKPSETLGIGDRLETDIASAQSAGCLSGFVLSGVSTLEQLSGWTPKPDIIASDLTTIING